MLDSNVQQSVQGIEAQSMSVYQDSRPSQHSTAEYVIGDNAQIFVSNLEQGSNDK